MPASADSLSLIAVSDQLAAAAEAAARAVVAVHARDGMPSTGVHWRDGLIVTTAGTVRRDQRIVVTLPSGARVPAALVGRDVASDLAVLRVDEAPLPPAGLGDAAALRPGHLVLGVARLDDSGPRVAFGAVSSVGGAWRSWKGGEYTRRLQSSLTVYPGFGGSPLVNAAGQVVGITSGGLSREFATSIAADDVERVLVQLVATGHVPRGWLGVALQPVHLGEARAATAGGRDGGLLIVGVSDGGPAATRGLLVGDVVLAVSGVAVHDPADVQATLDRTPPGEVLIFDVLRGDRAVRVPVTIGARPRDAAGAERGAGRGWERGWGRGRHGGR